MTFKSLRDFESVLPQVWSRETSSNPDRWNPCEPSKWQCDVTSMAVRDCFERVYPNVTLLREKGKFSDGLWRAHYFNMFFGERIDLAPFYSGEVVRTGRSRELCPGQIRLMFADLNFARRYRIFREALWEIEKKLYSS